MTTFFKSFLSVLFVALMTVTLSAQTYNTPGVYDLQVTAGTTLEISATGADGGGSTNTIGGSGGSITSSFPVNTGDFIRVIVGESGIPTSNDGAGGGGTAVINCGNSLANCDAGQGTLLAVAGAGGGAGLSQNGFGATNIPGTGNNGAVGFISIAEGGQGVVSASQAGCIVRTSTGGGGFGRGGNPAQNEGGGGAGYTGGNGGANQGGGAGGGSNFVDASAISSTNNPGVAGGGTASNGSVTFSTATVNQISYTTCDGVVQNPPAAVPTMGEWALIILALIMMSLGVVTVMRWKTVQSLQTAGGNAQMSLNTSNALPFNKKSYFQILPLIWGGLVAVFAIAVAAFGYEMTGADVPGALMAGAVGAYLVHLIKK